MTVAVDTNALRHIAGHFATGVVVVTGIDDDDRPVGITCQSFVSVSLDPPLVLFCPGSSSSAWRCMRARGSFCVNVLDATQHDLCLTFASKVADRFDGVGWRPAGSGPPILDGVIAWLECGIVAAHPAGDHDIVVGQVVALGGRDMAGHESPLVYFRGRFGEFASTA